jgi:formate C-acetyltransferase
MRREQEIYCDPFASALVEGCMESGVDLLRGGSALRALWHITAQGLATAADSLSAIRKFVYEEKTFTLKQIFEMLEKNFSGYEEMRLMLENRTECFGNDIDGVDSIAADILRVYAETVHGFNSENIPGVFVTSVFSYTLHVRMGETVMATANGRRKGMPLSDNAGPSQGKDKGGPTRLINSIIKLDHAHITGGYAFNLKINDDWLKEKSGINAFKGLIKTYFEQGGLQMQFNFISSEILKEAQKHPENYEGLLVRVAGFCEYFNKLDKNLQDEIISRTMHEEIY